MYKRFLMGCSYYKFKFSHLHSTFPMFTTKVIAIFTLLVFSKIHFTEKNSALFGWQKGTLIAGSRSDAMLVLDISPN